jgi:hypothetical protein
MAPRIIIWHRPAFYRRRLGILDRPLSRATTAGGVARPYSSNTPSLSRRAMRPSCCQNLSPREGGATPRRERALPQEGSGECRVPVAPAAACAKVVSTRVSHHEFTGITRHSRARWCYSLFRALPGDRACLSPSSAKSACRARQGRHRSFANLTPASGRQDHTTSPSAR